MNIIEGLDQEIQDLQKKLGRILEVKRLARLLPSEIQQLPGSISTWNTSQLSITLTGGDRTYAELFDLGLDFPPKPTFNEYNRGFSRETSTRVLDETRMIATDVEGVKEPKVIEVSISVAGIEKPPSCKIEEYEVEETVTKYKAVCEESGEEL